MDEAMVRAVRMVVKIVLVLMLWGVMSHTSYRANLADTRISLNTVVVTGFPAPVEVMQVTPDRDSEEKRAWELAGTAVTNSRARLVQSLGFVVNGMIAWAIVHAVMKRWSKSESS